VHPLKVFFTFNVHLEFSYFSPTDEDLDRGLELAVNGTNSCMRTPST
jgi:hypothetical protein